MLARLAVFDGGCTLAAIEEVAADDPLTILDGMNTLGDQSLIQRHDTPTGEARFRMLELVREYAHERLAASGEEATARERHADLYFDLQLAGAGASMAEVPWQRLLLVEEDNLRAALRWATAQRDVVLGLRLVNALVPFWANRGAYREGRGWIEAIPGPSRRRHARSRPRHSYAHTSRARRSSPGRAAIPPGPRRYGEQALAHITAPSATLPRRRRDMRLLANGSR